MTKYEFKCTHEGLQSNTTVTTTTDAVDWPTLLIEFTAFLKGCGFQLPNGDLEFVE